MSSLYKSTIFKHAFVVGVFAIIVGIGKFSVKPYEAIFPSFVNQLANEYALDARNKYANDTTSNLSASFDAFHPLKGFTVVVTGSTSGIGKALVVATHKLGATIVALGRNPERLTKLKRQLCKDTTDCNFVPIVADSNDLVAISKAAEEIKHLFDRIDFLINNAGIHYSESVFDLTTDYVTKQGYDLAFGGENKQ